MARFLSPEWFAEVAAAGRPQRTAGPEGSDPVDLVLEQVVRDTPDGEVRYRVVVEGRSARIEPSPNGAAADADLTIVCDWPTAAAIAQGALSTHAALLAGRLRVHGNLARVAASTAGLAGLDPVPDEVRRRTTYQGPEPSRGP